MWTWKHMCKSYTQTHKKKESEKLNFFSPSVHLCLSFCLFFHAFSCSQEDWIWGITLPLLGILHSFHALNSGLSHEYFYMLASWVLCFNGFCFFMSNCVSYIFLLLLVWLVGLPVCFLKREWRCGVGWEKRWGGLGVQSMTRINYINFQ